MSQNKELTLSFKPFVRGKTMRISRVFLLFLCKNILNIYAAKIGKKMYTIFLVSSIENEDILVSIFSLD